MNAPLVVEAAEKVQKSEEQQIQSNVQISLQGVLPTGGKIDLALSGIGPKFKAELSRTVDWDSLSCVFDLKKKDGNYQIAYTLRVLKKIQEQNGNVEYRSLELVGTVIAITKEKFLISRNGDKELYLTVVSLAEE